MEIVPGTALQSVTSYEERSEVVCGGAGWRRSQCTPYYATNTTKPIGNMVTPHSGVGKGFEASDTNEHTTTTVCGDDYTQHTSDTSHHLTLSCVLWGTRLCVYTDEAIIINLGAKFSHQLAIHWLLFTCQGDEYIIT